MSMIFAVLLSLLTVGLCFGGGAGRRDYFDGFAKGCSSSNRTALSFW